MKPANFKWVRLPEGIEVARDFDATDFFACTVAEMDISGTGYEDLIFASVRAYLALLSKKLPVPTMAEMALAAELANRAGLVNYGVSLRTAWIEEEGRAWCADYDAWALAGSP